MRYCAVFAIAMLLLTAAVIGGEYSALKARVWKDRDGNEVIEGRFDDISGSRVTIVHEGGLRRVIEIGELSPLDQQLIGEILRARTTMLFYHLGAGSMEPEDIVITDGKVVTVMRQFSTRLVFPRNLEEVRQGLSRDLIGKTVRLSGRVTGTERPKGSSQRCIDFNIEYPQLRHPSWSLMFRNRFFIPAKLLEADDIQDGDAIMLEGRFLATTDLCPKCRGTELVRCSYCVGGWTRTTIMENRVTPDGIRYAMPTGIKVVCSRCDGSGRLPCDHYVKPISWNPFDTTDPNRSIVGQLVAGDPTRALSLRLQDMVITFVSQDRGTTLRISRPAGAPIKVEYPAKVDGLLK